MFSYSRLSVSIFAALFTLPLAAHLVSLTAKNVIDARMGAFPQPCEVLAKLGDV